jgi:hypothetical protein
VEAVFYPAFAEVDDEAEFADLIFGHGRESVRGNKPQSRAGAKPAGRLVVKKKGADP